MKLKKLKIVVKLMQSIIVVVLTHESFDSIAKSLEVIIKYKRGRHPHLSIFTSNPSKIE